jgi:hypothetical protein
VTDKALAGELERLAKAALQEAPTPWETDTEKSEGEYGAGPDTSTGFSVSLLLDAKGRSLFDALNSTATIVYEDYPDEDGFVSAWDETSKANAALIVALVNNLPTILAALSLPASKPFCGTCGADVTEVLCPKCAKWWADNPPPASETGDAVEGFDAAIRCAELALFVIRKQGVMPNSSWEGGFNSDLAKAKAARAAIAATPADETVALLREARLQIEYLHDKFQETGSGNAVLARLDAALDKGGA